VEEKKV
jgi:hypothetical protein